MGTPGWTNLHKEEFLCPLMLGGCPAWVGGMTGVGDFIVNRELTCPVALHPKCGAVGTCPDICLMGSLTLMYMASLMVLVMPFGSLPNMEKLSSLMMCTVVWEWLKMEKEALICTLYLLPKFLPVLPMYSMVHPGGTSIYVYDSPFITDAVLILGYYQ